MHSLTVKETKICSELRVEPRTFTI